MCLFVVVNCEGEMGPQFQFCLVTLATTVVRREDFFGTAYVAPDSNGDDEVPQRDPNSLAERIRANPDVTNFVPVEGAGTYSQSVFLYVCLDFVVVVDCSLCPSLALAVPILTFDWEGINIDLLFARLNSNTVPPDFGKKRVAVNVIVSFMLYAKLVCALFMLSFSFNNIERY